MRRAAGALVFVVLAAMLPRAQGETPEKLRNHYGDPFVQVTNAIAACPLPRGPFMTTREAQAEAHPRIERGTTCHLAGKCSEPNAYRYDARIALAAQEAVRESIARSPALARSSVWLTVQRRFVFVHGCVASRGDAARWESMLRKVADVEYVGVDVAVVGAVRSGQALTASVHIPYPQMPKEQ